MLQTTNATNSDKAGFTNRFMLLLALKSQSSSANMYHGGSSIKYMTDNQLTKSKWAI